MLENLGGVSMTPNVSVRTFKPRQQVFSKEQPMARPRFRCSFPVEQAKVLAIVSAVVVVLGVGLAQIIQGGMGDLQGRAEQLRTRNTAVADENVRLLAARAQLSSKAQVVALAKTKLHLFEPDQRQVRRM